MGLSSQVTRTAHVGTARAIATSTPAWVELPFELGTDGKFVFGDDSAPPKKT